MGKFIGLKISQEDIEKIAQFQKIINLPNCVKGEKLHCSLLATKDELQYVAQTYSPAIVISELSLKKMKTKRGVDCLVIAFDNEQLQEKYKELKENYGIRSIYPSLKLHLTISYDCGDVKHPILSNEASNIFNLG